MKPHFEMDLDEPAFVGIDLFNMVGQLIRSFPQRLLPSGPNQRILLEVHDLPSGTYLYRIAVKGSHGEQYSTGTMTIIH